MKSYCYIIWLITYWGLTVAYIASHYVWHEVYNCFPLDSQGDNSVLLSSFIIWGEMKAEWVVVWSTVHVAKMRSLRHQGLEKGLWIPELHLRSPLDKKKGGVVGHKVQIWWLILDLWFLFSLYLAGKWEWQLFWRSVLHCH